MNNYFIRSTERQGSCYYEFYAGTWNRKKMQFWHKNSICITDNDFYNTGLEGVIAEVIPSYNPWGETVVTKQDWDDIMQKAAATGGKLLLAAEEANAWANQNFFRHKVFTILGL